MFKRFTERARKVIILAREEADNYQHEYLGTEHIILGVLKDGGGTGSSAKPIYHEFIDQAIKLNPKYFINYGSYYTNRI